MTRNMDKRIERVEEAVAGTTDSPVYLFCWANFDKTAPCVVRSGDMVFEHHPGESYKSFTDRVVKAARQNGRVTTLRIENLHKTEILQESN
jgi:hypothetical protein